MTDKTITDLTSNAGVLARTTELEIQRSGQAGTEKDTLGEVMKACGFPHPGYAARRYLFLGQGAFTATGGSLTANRIYLRPVLIPERITISNLSVNVKTGQTSAQAQLALYNQDPSAPHRPGTLARATGSQAVATNNTNVEPALSSNVTLAPGWYFAAINTDVNSTAYTAPSSTNFKGNETMGADSLAALFIASTNSHSMDVYVSQTYGTWPDLTGATFVEEAGAGRFPLMGFLAASVP